VAAPAPAYDLPALDQAMVLDTSRPMDLEWRPLDLQTYAARLPGMPAPIRLTTSAGVFEESSDSHQFFSPGGYLFTALAHWSDSGLSAEPQPGICWLLRDQRGNPVTFVVNTDAGFCQANSLSSLLTALARPGSPAPFPSADWPGYEAALVA
jgi:hypothetical protein